MCSFAPPARARACDPDGAAHGPAAGRPHSRGGFGAWKATGGPVEMDTKKVSTGERESAMTLRLIIGNKNYSSWSMPWSAMKVAGIAFEEGFPNVFKERLLKVSGTGKVPT